MIFVKDSLGDVTKTQVNESGIQEDLELSKFLNRFQDVFIDDIPREVPPKRGDDDHAIELIPGSSPPNKPPYRVLQAQQEEIMRQVNEFVEKGMESVLAESKMMIPDCTKRLEAALGDLQAILEEAEAESAHGSEEIEEAKKLVSEVEARIDR
ncbi:hypothetical protein L7F22_024756 [Adiantum nelumboides]|nr:hypothetical protein [Adiantum nelumboides]